MSPAKLSAFSSSLLDHAGRPNLIVGSTQDLKLTWSLINSAQPGQEFVVTPFDSGPVSPDQFHFLFEFAPGALVTPPTLPGWDIYVTRDGQGAIGSLYIALPLGSAPLKIAPGESSKAILTYKNAIQEDSNNSKVTVSLTAGDRVTLGGESIKDSNFRLADLTLVPANTPSQSAAPVSVDFVGRRTVLNDGVTPNIFTFALTNMTQTGLSLTPKSGILAASPTVFTVWFDAAPNQPDQPYPWALAKVENLDSPDVGLAVPSTDWTATKSLTNLQLVPGNPQWTLTVKIPVVLLPQEPVFFIFSGIRTDLDPGVTRMYLRYENLPGFLDGVLMGELEKSPLIYGTARGNGLYLAAGTPKANTTPTPTYHNGLFVNQFGNHPAATFHAGQSTADTVVQLTNESPGGGSWQFLSTGSMNSAAGAGKLLIQEGTNLVATFQKNGRVGIATPTPNFPLHIEGPVTDGNGGSVYIGGSGNPAASLRFGVNTDYGWIQTHGGEKPLALNPVGSPVGIGNPEPKNTLHVGMGQTTIANNRVNVVVATKGSNTGIAIAQEGGNNGAVNMLLQASGAGGYIGTASNHSLVFRTNDADRVHIDKEGLLTANNGLTVNNGANLKGPLTASGPVSMFGNKQDRQIDTNYRAETDGIVWAYLTGSDPGKGFCMVILDANLNGQWVTKCTGGAVMGMDKKGMRNAGSLCFAVPKGATWNVVRTIVERNTDCEARVCWMPIGTTQTAALQGPSSEELVEPNVAPMSREAYYAAAADLVSVIEGILKQSFTEHEKVTLHRAIKRLI